MVLKNRRQKLIYILSHHHSQRLVESSLYIHRYANGSEFPYSKLGIHHNNLDRQRWHLVLHVNGDHSVDK
jgi:hypothetical protein